MNLMVTFDEVTYCDECGGKLASNYGYLVPSLPFDIASANIGESATMHKKCFFKKLAIWLPQVAGVSLDQIRREWYA